MLTDSRAVSIPATSTVNVFLGQPSEFLGIASVGQLHWTADAAGLNGQLLTNIGGQQNVPVAAGSTLNVASLAGAGPKEDEDMVATNIPYPAGSRNQLNITNTTGAAIIMRYRHKIAP